MAPAIPGHTMCFLQRGKMKPNWAGFKKACLGQIALFLACFCVWFYCRTAQYLASPPQGDELYAQTWSFQLVVGGLLLLGSIPLLATLFLVEAALFHWLLSLLNRLRSKPTARAAGSAAAADAVAACDAGSCDPDRAGAPPG